MDLQERVIYNKEVQTNVEETGTNLQDMEDEIRQRILREKEVEAERVAREKELEEESVKLDQEIEQEIRGKYSIVIPPCPVILTKCLELSEEERASIFSAPDFLDFVEQSSKILQRALNDNYDYIRDYTIGAESGG